MKLQECLDRLALGELENTALVKNNQFKPEKLDYVISLMNETLQRLYSRFILKEDYVLLALNELTTNYVLTKEHAYSIDEVPPCSSEVCVEDYNKYIIQTKNHPFTENILRILRVTSPHRINIPLNDATNPESVFTPTFNTLQVPLLNRDGELAVSYQAKHPELTKENLQAELELPENFYGAFFAYVSHLAYSNMQSDKSVETAQKFFAIYTAQLDELVTYDLANSGRLQTNIKFSKYGWC